MNRVSETQLQVGEKINDITWRLNGQYIFVGKLRARSRNHVVQFFDKHIFMLIILVDIFIIITDIYRVPCLDG